MRPLRALAGLAALVGLWLLWRAPAIRADFAQLSAGKPAARVATAMAPTRSLATAPTIYAAPTLSHTEVAISVSTRSPPRRLPALLAAPPVERSPAAAAPTLAAAPPTAPAPTLVVNEEPAAVGYRALELGDRREAVRAFRTALSETPDDARAPAWARQLAAIEKRWSGSAYVLARDAGTSGLAAAPVLGGGQSGGQLVYALDPLARAPLAVEARLSAPNAHSRDGAQAALGLSLQLRPGLGVTFERLFALGGSARRGWTGRVAGGAATARSGRHWLDASIYAEAGAVGVRGPAFYGALQGRVGRGIALSERASIAAGIGGWASAQHDGRTIDRAEIGPTIRLRAGALEAAVDYRLRVTGNAAPGSGMAATVAAFF